MGPMKISSTVKSHVRVSLLVLIPILDPEMDDEIA